MLDANSFFVGHIHGRSLFFPLLYDTIPWVLTLVFPHEINLDTLFSSVCVSRSRSWVQITIACIIPQFPFVITLAGIELLENFSLPGLVNLRSAPMISYSDNIPSSGASWFSGRVSSMRKLVLCGGLH